jgi:hypothetical protein
MNPRRNRFAVVRLPLRAGSSSDSIYERQTGLARNPLGRRDVALACHAEPGSIAPTGRRSLTRTPVGVPTSASTAKRRGTRPDGAHHAAEQRGAVSRLSSTGWGRRWVRAAGRARPQRLVRARRVRHSERRRRLPAGCATMSGAPPLRHLYYARNRRRADRGRGHKQVGHAYVPKARRRAEVWGPLQDPRSRSA